jgi:hypothetical protein
MCSYCASTAHQPSAPTEGVVDMTPGKNGNACQGWYLDSAPRKRVFTTFPAQVDSTPHARHGRQCDESTPTRERIMRPLVSTPRRVQDWQ